MTQHILQGVVTVMDDTYVPSLAWVSLHFYIVKVKSQPHTNRLVTLKRNNFNRI